MRCSRHAKVSSAWPKRRRLASLDNGSIGVEGKPMIPGLWIVVFDHLSDCHHFRNRVLARSDSDVCMDCVTTSEMIIEVTEEIGRIPGMVPPSPPVPSGVMS